MTTIANINKKNDGTIKLEYKKIICPVCKGKGKIKPFKKLSKQDKRILIVELRKHRFSFREIMKLLNYKSTNSISNILEDK